MTKRVSFAELPSEARVDISARLLAHLIAYASLAGDDTVRAVRVRGISPAGRRSAIALAKAMLAKSLQEVAHRGDTGGEVEHVSA